MENPENSNFLLSHLNKLIKSSVFFLLVIWLVLQFFIPLFLPSYSITDLSGVVGLQNNEPQFKQIPFPGKVVYQIGDYMCHQRADRSFFINGNQMPFCSRCTAIWLGLAVGLGFMFLIQTSLSKKIIWLMLLAVVPLGIDGGGQLLGLWESTNLIRFLTGLTTGTACGIAVGIIIEEITTERRKKHNKN